MEFSFLLTYDFYDPIFWELWQSSEKLEDRSLKVDQDDSNEQCKRHIMEELDESFTLFDIDGDGKISAHELYSVLKSLGRNISMEEAQEIVDENGNGVINSTDFKNAMQEKMKQWTVEEDIKDAFNVFDANEDGFITLTEIQKLFEKLGEAITLEEAVEITADGDFNDDGVMTTKSSKRFCKKMNEEHTKLFEGK